MKNTLSCYKARKIIMRKLTERIRRAQERAHDSVANVITLDDRDDISEALDVREAMQREQARFASY